MSASDGDVGQNTRIEYSLTGDKIEDKFLIDKTTGIITLVKPLDRDPPSGRPEWMFNVLGTFLDIYIFLDASMHLYKNKFGHVWAGLGKYGQTKGFDLSVFIHSVIHRFIHSIIHRFIYRFINRFIRMLMYEKQWMHHCLPVRLVFRYIL